MKLCRLKAGTGAQWNSEEFGALFGFKGYIVVDGVGIADFRARSPNVA